MRILLSILLIGLSQVSGQVTSVNLTAPAPNDPGDDVVLSCEYALDAAVTLQYVVVQHQGSGVYEDIVAFNETDSSTVAAARYTGDGATADFYTVTISSVLEADEGLYKCVITDSVGNQGEDTADLAVTNVDACDSSPCMNEGTCADGVDTFTCTCPSCYTDATCSSQAINECASNPCTNGGSCTDECDKFVCTCPINYGGTTCATACNGITNITSDVNALLGSDTTLTCEIATLNTANGDKVYWSMSSDGVPVMSNAASHSFKAMKSHVGNHYCFVEKAGCKSREMLTMDVYYELSPNTTEYENVTVEEQEGKELKCEASGKPTPFVQWFFVPMPEETMDNDDRGNSSTPAPRTPPPPKALGNATENSTVYEIARASKSDQGRYFCVASLAGGDVEMVVKEINVKVLPMEGSSGLKAWEIALIVIGVLLFVGILVAVIIIIVWKTKKNKKAVNPSEKAERGKAAPYNRPESRSQKSRLRTDDKDEDENVLPPTPSPKPKRKKKNSKKYEDSSPRPLPAPPAGARGGTLPPLDLEAEKSKKKKKNKKRRQQEEDDGDYQQDSGNED